MVVVSNYKYRMWRSRILLKTNTEVNIDIFGDKWKKTVISIIIFIVIIKRNANFSTVNNLTCENRVQVMLHEGNLVHFHMHKFRSYLNQYIPRSISDVNREHGSLKVF